MICGGTSSNFSIKEQIAYYRQKINIKILYYVSFTYDVILENLLSGRKLPMLLYMYIIRNEIQNDRFFFFFFFYYLKKKIDTKILIVIYLKMKTSENKMPSVYIRQQMQSIKCLFLCGCQIKICFIFIVFRGFIPHSNWLKRKRRRGVLNLLFILSLVKFYFHN